MAKEIKYENEGRVKMMDGISKLAAAVGSTLGPKGRNVIIERGYGSPAITKDGVTVAREITLEDKLENIGAQMVKDVATKTNETAGDGTTTATVLAEAIYREGLRLLPFGYNGTDMQRVISATADKIVTKLKDMSTPVTSDEQIEQIGTISANGDATIGKLIAEAMKKVGKDGIITIDESKTMETTCSCVEGMQIDHGYISPYFATDGEGTSCEFDEPLILLHEKKISNLQDMVPLLQQVAKSQRPLLIIAEDVDGEALATLVVNKLRGTINVCAVKSPGFGDRRKEIMKDLAALTNATYISEDLGMKLENVTLNDLGTAKKVTVDKETTTFVEGAGSQEAIAARINQIKMEIEKTTSDYDREKLQERLAKLTGGVAVISIGAATETEMKEKKDRVEDALHATRAAVEEGIVPGGGVALLRAAQAAESESDGNPLETIMYAACAAPLKKIVLNASGSPDVVCNEIVNNDNKNFGYNAAVGEYADMISAGIIDPTKVERCAIQNAASIAGMLLTTDCVITDLPEKDSCKCGSHGGAPMGMPGMM